MARSLLLSGSFSCVILLLVSSRAKPRDPGSFSTPADAPSTTDQARCVTLELHFVLVSFRAKRRIPVPILFPRPVPPSRAKKEVRFLGSKRSREEALQRAPIFQYFLTRARVAEWQTRWT